MAKRGVRLIIWPKYARSRRIAEDPFAGSARWVEKLVSIIRTYRKHGGRTIVRLHLREKKNNMTCGGKKK